MTRLNRRLLRWQRYDLRVRSDAWSPGHRRASGAIEREQRRRRAHLGRCGL